MKRILITGATGNVGREVVRHLLPQVGPELQVIVAAKDLDSAREVFREDRLLYRVLDMEEPATFPGAFAGVDALFLLRPPQLSNVKKVFVPLLQSVKAQNISQVVFLSLQGVENNSFTPHHKIEAVIRELEIPYTFLRPSFFMQNLTTTHLTEIRDRDEIFVPAGNGKTNFVDVADVGEVAAKVLLAPNHLGQAYELTGNEAYRYDEIAEIISKVTGRNIRYARPSLWSFFWRKKRESVPIGFILVMMALYTVSRLGKAAGHSPTMATLLSRPPVTFEVFAAEHAARWKKT